MEKAVRAGGFAMTAPKSTKAMALKKYGSWIQRPWRKWDYIETVTNKSIFNKANELEFVNGKIYANVYQKESMMIIDATSGTIEGVINFGGLKNKIRKGANWDEGNSVLNGVAYHKERGTFFVTGKNWDKLFEVQIRKKD